MEGKFDIKAAIRNSSLTQKEIAEALGVAFRTVESWMQDRRNPSAQIIMLIENGALDRKPEA